jgi:type II secretory pathway pseudopilin PulG
MSRERMREKACPSCGRMVALEARVCPCGARWVTLRPPEPEVRVPHMGKPLAAASLIGLILVIEGVILAHDVYVSPLVWTEVVLSWLAYEAWFVGPVALLAAYLAYRGWQQARREPHQYGGARIARASWAAAMIVFAVHAGALVARVPRMLENSRLRREAATRANLYRLASAIEAYKQQFGTYPRQLIDLQEMDPELKPVVDAWGHEFVYQAISGDVAAAAPMPFQRYQLVSKGSDGRLGTEDDIVLRDDVLMMKSEGERRAR